MQLRIILALAALIASVLIAIGTFMVLVRDSDVGNDVPRQELVEAAEEFQELSFRVEYEVFHSHSPETGTLAWYHAPGDDIRLDYTYVDEEGEAHSEILINHAGEDYSCNVLAATCTPGNEFVNNDAFSAFELAFFHPLYSASWAGTKDSETQDRAYTLRKFEQETDAANLECFRSSRDGRHHVLCFDDKGVPRRMQTGHDDVEVTLDAPGEATSVTAEDFTPPYPVQE